MISNVMQQCRWSYFELASLVALTFLTALPAESFEWNDSIKKLNSKSKLALSESIHMLS